MDPATGLDAVRDVGIRDGQIAAVSETPLAGTRVIDAAGHVVTAGFIDTHHHGAGTAWGVKASLRDGVTTPMDLELGAELSQDEDLCIRESNIVLVPTETAKQHVARGEQDAERIFVVPPGVDIDEFDWDDPAITIWLSDSF